ncbi:c-Jun protein-like (AP-1) [Hyalella azteca]|uniref:C-Jun protein-like (AP-1) n=1 Tax=Hyalella azteca TaxID=294128 RepID=A0A6A0GT98_HYAAZ|nr:transcription factor Jun-like [Hyalella azteca]KAA0187644.1 c-Jun protein-like (AP-1) [Hyalella azteca]
MFMETTMYNEDTYKVYSKENVAQAKRKLRLDLNIPGNGAKRQRPASLNPLLTSPDLNMLKLASPELDQLVLQQVGGQHLFPRVTHEQEEFAKGFVDSLEQMHSQNNLSNHQIPHIIVTSNNNTSQYTQLQPPQAQPFATSNQHIKEEPLTVPSSSPPLSPINMENQERIKLERKRLRNRLAASKCRRRKLERIGRLETKVAGLKAENSDLQAVVNRLRDQVCALKKEVMEHVQSGCQIPFVTHG